MTARAFLAAVSLVMGLGILAGTVEAQTMVNCNSPGPSIQDAVDSADGPTTIDITGLCVGDVTITKDDITLSGRPGQSPCNKANPGGNGTIDGTVTVDGVRAKIEFLEITGSGAGVNIINRADVHLTCNDISNNEAEGVAVIRSSNAVLRDNTLSGNGTRAVNPFIFFDCGLFAGDASSVRSDGNTYEDNQYCAIEIDRQSAFRNGAFLPRVAGEMADPAGRDVFTEKGCTPSTGNGCFTNDGGPVAIEVFNGGLVDLRNADVNGEIESTVLSSFRVDSDAAVQGNILAQFGSMARLRNREGQFPGERQVTYTGTLTCLDTSQAFFSSVQCGETCTGIIDGDTLPNTCVLP